MANYNGAELVAAMGITGSVDMPALLKSIEQALVAQALAATSSVVRGETVNNNSKAAAFLGLNRTTLVMKLDKWAKESE